MQLYLTSRNHFYSHWLEKESKEYHKVITNISGCPYDK